jgi:hypothetical protein|eukprot:COSAG01_NODE_1026_length_12047_cov_169.108554_2_plen_317_part_00
MVLGRRTASTTADAKAVYDAAAGVGMQHIWAPYNRRKNKNLGADTRRVFPYDTILAELHDRSSAPVVVAERGRRWDVERWARAPPEAELCAVGLRWRRAVTNTTVSGDAGCREVGRLPHQPCVLVGRSGGRHNRDAGPLPPRVGECMPPSPRGGGASAPMACSPQQWTRFCQAPTVVVLNFGLWQTEEWKANAHDLDTAMEVLQPSPTDLTPLKVLAILPWPVRRVKSRVPASGKQEDPEVEPEYNPDIIRRMGDELRRICAKNRCCFVVDTYDAAFHRPHDSPDGRHYDTMTSTLSSTISFMLDAINAPCRAQRV